MKYPKSDFMQMLNNPDFFNKIKDQILIKIKDTDIKVEELTEIE